MNEIETTIDDISRHDDILDGQIVPRPLTRVFNLAGNEVLGYSLPPSQAVIAAYEQLTRGNMNTWAYPKPEDHPQFVRGARSVSCGDWAASLNQLD
jgi:hypothetical protein